MNHNYRKIRLEYFHATETKQHFAQIFVFCVLKLFMSCLQKYNNKMIPKDVPN